MLEKAFPPSPLLAAELLLTLIFTGHPGLRGTGVFPVWMNIQNLRNRRY